jgi:NTP pyrophosphatase (non-canonical NTP hydrolase)
MNAFNLYQDEAMSFRLPSACESYALLGLTAEVGEVNAYIAKGLRDQYEIDPKVIKKELGDILWFVAAIASDLNMSLGSIAEANIDKLQSRSARGVIQGSGDDR